MIQKMVLGGNATEREEEWSGGDVIDTKEKPGRDTTTQKDQVLNNHKV